MTSEKSVDQAASAFRAHGSTIYRYLLRRTRNSDRAEELTQEVFADAAIALERFHPGSTPVLALLYTLAQRRFVDAVRRDAVRPQALVPFDEIAELVPEYEHDNLLGPALRAALAQLPNDLLAVATMKLVQGRSFAEIARTLDITEVACRKRFQRALEALRTALEDEGLRP